MREASGREEDAVIRAGTGHFGPCSIWTYIHPTPDIQIHQYLFETPVDESNTRLYLVNLRNFLTDATDDERVMGRNEVVALQDRDVLVEIQPVQTPDSNNHEFFVGADTPIARYRDYLKDWEARGWRIDTARVERDRKRVAYAIPSPARREQKGWVLDAVPLRPGAAATKAGKTARA